MINPHTGFLLAEERPLRTRAKEGRGRQGYEEGGLNVKPSLKRWLGAGLPSRDKGGVADMQG